ncbi:hypothetical protein AB0B45_31530 [Nonomuraea sp. NPDC049152]|uniref:hypothetical protein n=1 Tax=Nonomuraea sp. NPDC049152 TaxID=3154350 RepID=UPI0033C3DB37
MEDSTEPVSSAYIEVGRCSCSSSRRKTSRGNRAAMLGSELHFGIRAELSFKNGDLAPLSLFPQRQQPQGGKGVRDGQMGQAKEHE